jgi:polyphosphate glucokinase
MKVLVLDIGGRNVKVWPAPAADKLKIESGKGLTPRSMLSQLKNMLHGMTFDRVSMGYPGEINYGRITKDPYNLGSGWVDFDFDDAFGCPVRVMNDACMQALGAFDGGKMLYLGLGTSIGTALVLDGKVISLALGHLLLNNSQTFEEVLSRAGLKKYGLADWSAGVLHAVQILKNAFLVDYVMLGGGNAKKLDTLPAGSRLGGNFHAYIGGLRMWEDGHIIEHAQQLQTEFESQAVAELVASTSGTG